MFFSHDHFTTASMTTVSTMDLKNELFKSWAYADVDFIVDDIDLPARAYDIMQRVLSSLRALAVMNVGDINRHKLWQFVRPMISMMLDAGWTIQCGNGDGCLCVRIYDAASAIDDADVEFMIPADGARQLRNIESWLDSIVLV